MSDRVDIILARRADVFLAVSARRRLVWSLLVQCALCAALVITPMTGTIAPQLALTLVTAIAAVYVWTAVEGARMQRALREPRGVCAMTFVGMLVPPAAPILVIVMLWESVAVLKIARRMRKDQCARCGYDLRGISSTVCPECGHALASLAD